MCTWVPVSGQRVHRFDQFLRGKRYCAGGWGFWLKCVLCQVPSFHTAHPRCSHRRFPVTRRKAWTVLARTQPSLPPPGPRVTLQGVCHCRDLLPVVQPWGRVDLLTGFSWRPFWSQGSKQIADVLRFSTEPWKQTCSLPKCAPSPTTHGKYHLPPICLLSTKFCFKKLQLSTLKK